MVGDFENMRPTFSVPRKTNMLFPFTLSIILKLSKRVTLIFFSINCQILRNGFTANAQHVVRRIYLSQLGTGSSQ